MFKMEVLSGKWQANLSRAGFCSLPQENGEKSSFGYSSLTIPSHHLQAIFKFTIEIWTLFFLSFVTLSFLPPSKRGNLEARLIKCVNIWTLINIFVRQGGPSQSCHVCSQLELRHSASSSEGSKEAPGLQAPPNWGENASNWMAVLLSLCWLQFPD